MDLDPGAEPTLPALAGLADLTDAETERLIGTICRIQFAAGAEVAAAGPHATTMFHVLVGTVEARCGDRVLAHARPGEWLRADLTSVIGGSEIGGSVMADLARTDELEIDLEIVIVIVATTDAVVDFFDLRDISIVLDAGQRTGACHLTRSRHA